LNSRRAHHNDARGLLEIIIKGYVRTFPRSHSSLSRLALPHFDLGVCYYYLLYAAVKVIFIDR
jgi:hypothetical protein